MNGADNPRRGVTLKQLAQAAAKLFIPMSATLDVDALATWTLAHRGQRMKLETLNEQ